MYFNQIMAHDMTNSLLSTHFVAHKINHLQAIESKSRVFSFVWYFQRIWQSTHKHFVNLLLPPN